MNATLEILWVRFANGRFETEPVDALPAPNPDAFTLALTMSELDAVQSALAFACDFLAAAPDASLVAGDRALLRVRAGPGVDDAISPEGRIDGLRLHDLGLAAFSICTDIAKARADILRQADTLLALRRARRFSCPEWSAPSETAS